MKCAGVILAGGQSRRMDGVEKSLIQLNDTPLVSHLIERLSPQVSPLAINANGAPARFEFTGLPILPDTVDGFVGPLAGILTAMKWADQFDEITHVVTAAADTPFMPTDLVSTLTQSLKSEDYIAMASSNGRIHPVFAIWPKKLSNDLEKFLIVEDKRKILEFAERYQLREIVFEISSHDPFFNINTPRDLAVAEEIVRNTNK